MSIADTPRRRRALSLHVAPVVGPALLVIAALALAGVALTMLSPVTDIEVLRAVIGRGGAESVIARLAEVDALVARAYWAVLGLAGALLIAAIASYAGLSRLVSRSTQRLADSVVEASRADDSALVWGRDRADPLGVIARTVEFMHWERLEAMASLHEKESQGHVELIASAAAKADRIQDALSRSLNAVSQTCNDFQSILDRAEKALNLASNAAWDGAAAQRDQLNAAIAEMRAAANQVAEAQRAPMEAANDADATPIETYTNQEINTAVEALRTLTETLTRDAAANADAARALTAQAAAFATDARDASRHTIALAGALESADAHAGRLASGADALVDRVDALEGAVSEHAREGDKDGRALSALLDKARELVEALAAAASAANDDAGDGAELRLEDAIARLEALAASLSAAPPALDAPEDEDRDEPAHAAVAEALDSVRGVLETLSAEVGDLAARPAAATAHDLSALSRELADVQAGVKSEITTASAALEHAVRETLEARLAGASEPGALAEALERRLSPHLAPLTRLESLAAQIDVFDTRLAALGQTDAAAIADRVAAAVAETLEGQAGVPAPATPASAPAAPAANEAGLSPDAFEAERASFRRMAVAFELVLRDVNAHAARLAAAVERVEDGAGGSVLEGEVLAPAAPARATAADASPRLGALEARLDEVIEALRHAAADNARALAEATGDTGGEARAGAVLRALDGLSARAASLNEAITREGETLRAAIGGADADLGPDAEAMVTRLEGAAREARGHTAELLRVAATISHDLDHDDGPPAVAANAVKRVPRRGFPRRRAS